MTQNNSGGFKSKNKKNNFSKGKNRRYGRNKKPPGPKGPEGLVRKYLNLMDTHLLARKKYYELFFRADPNQREKLEKTFYNTLDQVRLFENNLSDIEKEQLKSRIEGQSLDRDYSSNHNLSDSLLTDLPEGPFPDPHVLPGQLKVNFKEDTEESSGTIEDYKSYKGL